MMKSKIILSLLLAFILVSHGFVQQNLAGSASSVESSDNAPSTTTTTTATTTTTTTSSSSSDVPSTTTTTTTGSTAPSSSVESSDNAPSTTTTTTTTTTTSSSSDVPSTTTTTTSGSTAPSSSDNPPSPSPSPSTSPSPSPSPTPTPTPSQDPVWNATVGDFNDPTNWNDGFVPSAGNNVTINTASAKAIITAPTNLGSGEIYLDNGADLDVRSTLTVGFINVLNENSTLFAESSSINATVINDGTVYLNNVTVSAIKNSNVVTISGPGSFSLTNSFHFMANNAVLNLGSSQLVNGSSNILMNSTSANFAGSNTVINQAQVLVSSDSNATFTSSTQIGGTAILEVQGQATFSQSPLVLSGTANITGDGLSNIVLQSVALTLNDQSQIISASTVQLTGNKTNLQLNDGSSININGGSLSSTGYVVDINDNAGIYLTNSGELNFANNQILLSANGSISNNGGLLTINGEVYASDTTQILVQNGAFNSATTTYTLSGNAMITVFNSQHNATDSTYNVNGASISYSSSVLNLDNSQYFLNASTLLLSNITSPNFSLLSATMGSNVKVNQQSSLSLSSNFTFSMGSQLSIDNSLVNISSPSFQLNDQSSITVTSTSTVTVINGYPLTFANSSTFTVSQSQLNINDNANIGIFNVKSSNVFIGPQGQLITTGFIGSNVKLFTGYENPAFANVLVNQIGGVFTLSPYVMTLRNAQLSLSQSEIVGTFSFNSINMTGSNLTLSANIHSTSDIYMDTNSLLTVDDTFNLDCNINGGELVNTPNGVITVTNQNAIIATNVVNSGIFNIQTGATIQQFANFAPVFNVTQVTMFVSKFTQANPTSVTNVVQGAIYASNQINIMDGTVNLSNGGLVNLADATPLISIGQGAILSGTGYVNGTLSVQGQVGSSTAPTKIAVKGTYAQQANSSLILTVTDTTNYSTLNVTGQANLQGNLIVVLTAPLPVTKDQSDIKLNLITFGSSVGKFDKVTYQLPPNAQQDGCNSYDITNSGISVTFGCLTPPPTPTPTHQIDSSDGTSNKSHNGKMRPGAVVGIIFAVLAFLGLIGVAIFFVHKKRNNRNPLGINEPLLNRKELN
ncbi:hypothetical protein DLAC_10345 [Tieghemostelium lacteum]|uniref:Transmembrane protein n=1 Tax=Tieghemostelium lacteum TaxID=361077 RepID=A0A151Z563_TIELA|nr:hypothetical protein DLAC_10345 [Tieghemostelium lacteum]|eukprot:KYQ89113.1 hypothetical protein DLAC_10345 [Tieghemostelium lacteum]